MAGQEGQKRPSDVHAPNGEDIVVAAGTPGGGRAMQNFVAELRGYGFVWKGR